MLESILNIKVTKRTHLENSKESNNNAPEKITRSVRTHLIIGRIAGILPYKELRLKELKNHALRYRKLKTYEVCKIYKVCEVYEVCKSEETKPNRCKSKLPIRLQRIFKVL